MRVDSPGTVVWFHREQRHWGLGICVLKPKKEYTGVLREVLPPGEKSNWGSHLFYFALLSSLNNCLWTVCSTSAAVTDVRSHDVRAACAPWTLLWFIEKNIFPNIWCFVSLDQKFLTFTWFSQNQKHSQTHVKSRFKMFRELWRPGFSFKIK